MARGAVLPAAAVRLLQLWQQAVCSPVARVCFAHLERARIEGGIEQLGQACEAEPRAVGEGHGERVIRQVGAGGGAEGAVGEGNHAGVVQAVAAEGADDAADGVGYSRARRGLGGLCGVWGAAALARFQRSGFGM